MWLQPVPTHCLALLSGARERGQLVAGGCGGRALRGSWVGTPPAPKEFIGDDFESAAAVSSAAAAAITGNVTALAASPYHPQVGAWALCSGRDRQETCDKLAVQQSLRLSCQQSASAPELMLTHITAWDVLIPMVSPASYPCLLSGWQRIMSVPLTRHPTVRTSTCVPLLQAFLMGTSSGCVSLHCTSAGPAVLLWPEVAAGGVAALAWSPSRPAAFMVLDGACNLHYFDLMQVRGAGPQTCCLLCVKIEGVCWLPVASHFPCPCFVTLFCCGAVFSVCTLSHVVPGT